MIGAYAYAYLRGDAAPIIEWMRASQIEEIRKRAPSADSPAWRDFPEEMWRKIVLKRLTKKLPTADPFTMKVMKDLEDTIEGESQAVAGEGLSALAYHPEVPFEAPPVDNREPVEHGQDERGWQDEQRREAEPDQDRGRREEPPRQDAPAARQQQAKGGGTKKQQPEWPE
jgi:recombinational DNA repair protein RecT